MKKSLTADWVDQELNEHAKACLSALIEGKRLEVAKHVLSGVEWIEVTPLQALKVLANPFGHTPYVIRVGDDA